MTRIVRPKNTLKEKVGTGGFKKENLEKAQKAIEENVIDFIPIANRYLAELSAVLSKEKDAVSSEGLYSAILDPLMQLRAQGAMFGYPSITFLTDIIVNLLDSLKNVDSTVVEIVQAYEKSAKMMLSTQIKDQDHKLCQAFAQEIKAVCKKYTERKADKGYVSGL